MAVPVSAQSLSRLNDLADDPPVHLDGRIRRERREPLIMYIARVPGSRDVFLTPMKPRDKVVSAHDVESSLYYCHLETDDDELVRATLCEDPVNETSPGKPDAGGLTNSDVSPLYHDSHFSQEPVASQPSHQGSEIPSAVPPPSLPRAQTKISRKPVGSATSFLPANPVSLASRPFGPRPMEPRAPTSPVSGGKENIRPAASHKPPLPPRQGSTDHAPVQPSRPNLPPRACISTGNLASVPAPPPSLPPRRDSTDTLASFTPKRDFAVTLIRRDPGSGQQWNVGRMVRSSWKQGGADSGDVVLSLSTPGYAKFDAPALPRRATGSETPPPPDQLSSTFTRILSLRRKQRDHSQSQLPFSFSSPWDGPCAFATGVAGRSLRCRHIFPPPTATAFDPKLALLDSVAVSELRLNLPVIARKRHTHIADKSKLLRRPSVEGSMGERAAGSRASFLSASRMMGHRPAKSVDASMYEDQDDEGEDDDEWSQAREPGRPHRMDLSLGRERAGGGFGGKKAKLGKVIVEAEGLLMLDLVVLANMAIWWAVAEEGDP